MNLKLSLLTVGLIALSAFGLHSNSSAVYSETVASQSIEWLNIETAESVQKTSSKAIIVDVYTDWCKWCKVMDTKTFKDPKVEAYLSANYHMVKLNAEQKEPIAFNGKNYAHVAKGRNGIHELAIELLGVNMSYPSFVILNSEMEKIGTISGFKNAEAFLAEVKRITANS